MNPKPLAALVFLLPIPTFAVMAWFTRTINGEETLALLSPLTLGVVAVLVAGALVLAFRGLGRARTLAADPTQTAEAQAWLVSFPKLVLVGGFVFGMLLAVTAALTGPGLGTRWGDLLLVGYANAMFFSMPPYILFLQAFEQRSKAVPFSSQHLSMSLGLRVNLVSAFVLTSMLAALLVALKNVVATPVAGQDAWGQVVAVGLPIGLAGLIIGVFNLFLLMRGIVTRIDVCKGFTEELAAGDVSRPALEMTSRDELGVLADRLNQVKANLGRLLGSTKASVDKTIGVKDQLLTICGSTSQEVARIGTEVGLADERAQQILEGADKVLGRVQKFHGYSAELNKEVARQSTMVEETSSSLAQMTGGIEEVARLSSSRVEAARDLEAQTVAGGGKMRQTLEQLNQISGSVEDIRGITRVIQNIAAQTNLLAMNAAIEAAHAGSAGAGFAVVADEIRKLAQTSARNSQEITQKVKAIVLKIGTTVEAGQQTSDTLAVLNTELGQFLTFFREIETAMGEMRAGGTSILSASQALQGVSAEVGNRSRALDAEADALATDMEALAGQARDTRRAMAAVGASVVAVTDASVQLKDHTVLLDQSTRAVSEQVDQFRV